MKNGVMGILGMFFVGVTAQAAMVPSQRAEFDKSTQVDLSDLKDPSGYADSLDEVADETVMVDRSGMEYRDDGAEEIQNAMELDAGGDGFSRSFDGLSAVRHSALRALGLENVIGIDTRVQVTNTTDVSVRKIGRIGLGCTATLISPRLVLTAGHCVFNRKTGKWYENLDFTPGQNGNAKPFGTIAWSRAVSVNGYTKDGKTESDYAVIVLKESVGNALGWMAFGYSSDLGNQTTVNIKGYPGDKPQGTMWHSSCKIALATSDLLTYPCSTFAGNSGSAVYRYVPAKNERIIYGVHTNGGKTYNWGTRITKAKFDRLKKWTSENP